MNAARMTDPGGTGTLRCAFGAIGFSSPSKRADTSVAIFSRLPCNFSISRTISNSVHAWKNNANKSIQRIHIWNHHRAHHDAVCHYQLPTSFLLCILGETGLTMGLLTSCSQLRRSHQECIIKTKSLIQIIELLYYKVSSRLHRLKKKFERLGVC